MISATSFTAIWQKPNLREREWFRELFGDLIHDEIADGKRAIVLDNAIVFDSYIGQNNLAYYSSFAGRNALFCHYGDENFDGPFSAYKNFLGVIRTAWSGIFNRREVEIVPLGYSRGLIRPPAPLAASKRPYLWCFVGHLGKSSRPDMAQHLKSLEPHQLFATDPNEQYGKTKDLSKESYFSTLADSIFSPCPMGNANIECYRVYEALECGSIPVVERRLTLNYYGGLLGAFPFPSVRSWKSAAGLIRDAVRNPAGLDTLQGECISWWQMYKKSHSERLSEFVARRFELGHRVKTPVSPIAGIPGWNGLELLRHHDWYALRRRLEKQANRLLTERHWRKAQDKRLEI